MLKLVKTNPAPLDDPSFWESYNNYLLSDYDAARDEALINSIAANPPPREYEDMDYARDLGLVG